MIFWSYAPIWIIDFFGSAAMILLSAMCLYLVRRLFNKDPESPLFNYLFWFIGAIFAFSVSRSLGHIIRHILYFAGHSELWKQLAPISGSINSITFVVIASVTLFFYRMQTIMVRMGRDRSRIEKTSREILELNKNIESIIFERTKAEMALRVAHDVRNPVMIIGGLVRRLLKSTSEECLEDKNRLLLISEQALKLEQLVKSFEQVRPARKITFSPLDLNQIVDATLEVVEPEATKKDITILLDRVQSPLHMLGNEQHLRVALMHIIRNAIEASGSGNIVQISTELNDKGIEVMIKDDGPGIAPEILEHIYKPFFLTDSGEETGLGIPYVKQIISEHKGSMIIDSSKQTGTSVHITLPTHLGILHEKTQKASANAPP